MARGPSLPTPGTEATILTIFYIQNRSNIRSAAAGSCEEPASVVGSRRADQTVQEHR